MGKVTKSISFYEFQATGPDIKQSVFTNDGYSIIVIATSLHELV